MPYKVKGNCIYKKDGGTKVGCTKGSVKKYLAALHANVNESTELADKPKTGDYLYCIKELIKKSGPEKGSKAFIVGHYYRIWFSEEHINVIESELGKDVNFYTDQIPEYFIVVSKEDYEKHQDFDPFNLIESEEDNLEWAQDIVNTESIDITKDKKHIDLLKVGSIISITGDWESLSFDNDRATIIELGNKNISFLLKFDRVIESEGDHSHCGEYEHHKICECEDNNVVGKCWYTGISSMDRVIWYPYEYNETLNESEEDSLEWAQDTVNSKPIYRFRDLVFKPHSLPGAVRARLYFPNGHYISVVGGPLLYGDGVDTFEIWASSEDEPEGYLTKVDVTNRMLELQELPPLEDKGPFNNGPITESEEEEEFDWVKDIINLDLGFDDLKIGDVVKFKDTTSGYWLATDIYMTDPNMTGGRPSEKRIKFISVRKNGDSNFSYWSNSSLEYAKTPINSFNFFELVRRKGLNESEEDELEWAFDTVKQNPLEFHGMELMIDVDDLTKNERAYFLGILYPYIDKELDAAVNSGDWSWDCLIKNEKVKTISLHCGTEDNDYIPQRGRVCCLSYKFGDKKEANPDSIIPLNARDIISNHKSNLTESEENDLEWAQDLVSNVDSEIKYSNFRQGGKLLPDGVILKITGHQDEIDFNNQECKVIRFMDEENNRYLCVFPEVIRSEMGGYTHCGNRQDEEKCHCLEFGGSDGRCYEIEMDHMSEVYYYPNRLKLTTESEEEKPLLTEGRYDAITRKAVNDIMAVVKETANQVEFNQAVLPSGLGGDEEYTQEGMSFSIELNVHHQPLFSDRVAVKESDAYYVHTAVANEEDENVIMMTIVVDPTWEPQIYERLFYKLQEDIRHEIEHLTQLGIHRISDRPLSRTNTAQLKTTFGHHKNKLEVPALVHGFYRRAKLEKRGIDEVMIEDLDSEIERGNLTKRAAQSLLTIWIDYSKKNLPAAIYSQE